MQQILIVPKTLHTWCKAAVAHVSSVTTAVCRLWLCSGGLSLSLCVCQCCGGLNPLSWLRPSSSEAEAGPAARPGPTVGNSLCVIVRAMNCWWRICLCACSNNGNIKYLAWIIIIHFLAMTKKNLTNRMEIKNKQTRRWAIVFCGYDDDLSASTLHGEHYLRLMCASEGIRPSHEGNVHSYGKSSRCENDWKFVSLHVCCVLSRSLEILIKITNLSPQRLAAKNNAGN